MSIDDDDEDELDTICDLCGTEMSSVEGNDVSETSPYEGCMVSNNCYADLPEKNK